MTVEAGERAAAFEVQPLTERCREIWQRGDHILIGMSTGNSYFSTQRLIALLCWAQEHFRAVDLVVADTHIDAMLVAEGCDPAEAEQRARRRVAHVQRRVRRALRDTSPAHGATAAHMLSDFQSCSRYLRARARVEAELANHPPFARACRAMVGSFLTPSDADEGEGTVEGEGEGEAPYGEDRETDPRLRAGLAYVVNELPFILDTPAILGVETSLSTYHVLPPAADALFRRPGALRPADGQGFAVVSPAADAAANTAADMTATTAVETAADMTATTAVDTAAETVS